MPSSALQATITAALAPIVAMVYLLIHVPESTANQSIIVVGASAIVAVVFGVYAAFAHHQSTQIKVAQINVAASNGSPFSQSDNAKIIAQVPRKRPSRAKPKTPPAA